MHLIDVHHHILPPEYVRTMVMHGVEQGFGDEPSRSWDAESAIEVMERQGIDMAITSISAPSVYFGKPAIRRKLARSCNEYSAEIVARYPGRFGAFAVLPMPDVESSLMELEHALDVLKLQGVALLSNADGIYLGEPEFNELFEELNRRKAVVFLHPGVSTAIKQSKTGVLPFMVEVTFETTRAAAYLVFGGTCERCPDVKIILAHAGGTIPYLAGRMILSAQVFEHKERIPKGCLTYLKRFYFDIALSAFPFSLRSLQELAEPTHILFGSDYPFAPEVATALTIAGLKSYDGFDEATLSGIERENALALFPSHC
jgi:predicted TIM-barrel fold metal-dependent hydrolase